MVIIYPEIDYNSFIDETEAASFMGKQINSGYWFDYSSEQQEMLLVQTASQIRLCPNIVLPETNEEDLKLGQAYLLLQASRVDMTDFDADSRSITKEKVDTLEVEYDVGYKGDKDSFPPMSTLYLNQYGCSSSSGFSQVSLGRN